MYNKRLLSKIDLGKYNKPNPYSKDIIVDPQGQYNHPGVPTRIPSNDITMKGVGYPVLGIADNGQKQMMQPGQDYKFPGAKYVDEYPQMKKGGGLNSKKYTRSLEGIGELFRESALFKKPKSKKKKFFHPNAKYFQQGGVMIQEEMDGAACPPGYAKHPLTGECVIVNPSDISQMPSGEKRSNTIKNAMFAQDVDQTQQYFRDYYNSPRYREMITNSAGPTAYVYTQTRKNNLENIPSVVNNAGLRDKKFSGMNAIGVSYNDTGKIEIDQQRADEGTMSHEFSHSTDRPSSVYTYPGMNAIYHQNPDGNWFISSNSTGNVWKPITDADRAAALSSPFGGTTEYNMARVIPPKDVDAMNTMSASSYLNSPYYYRLSPEEKKKYKTKYETDSKFKQEEDKYLKYVTEPTETRARLNAIRFEAKDFDFYDPFTQKVDSKIFQKLKEQNIKGLNELRLFYNDQEIIKMLNTISKNQNKQESVDQTQMAKRGGAIKKFAPGGVASPKDLDPEHMKRYLADLRMQENSIRKGYKNGMWYPHASVEGGADTIAYGHKLTPNDAVLRRGITEDQALKLQEQDVLKNQSIAKKQVDKKYGPGTFDNLPQDSQMLLVDYQYNLGTLSGFPSFVKATVEGNKEKMLAEHKRFGAGKPLTKRNEWTANVINNLEIPKPYDPMKEVTVPLANVPDATSVVQPDFLQGPTAVELPPQKYQGGGVVELNGYQYVKNPANGTWTFTSGAPVTDAMTMQKLNYGEGKPVGSRVVQEAPGRLKAKETIVNASKNVKPQVIERNIPRANVSDATSVTKPFIPKPSFVDQPSLVDSLKYPEKLQDEAQRLITSGAARDMGITAKYLSPQNANSANPKSLQQLMIEEMTKKDFQKRLDQSRLNKVNKKWNESSTLGKVGDVTRSFLADPINVTEEAIWGDQYLPDRANILRDPRNPLNAYYRKETGYDNSALNNMVSMINPFSSAADATVYARQGNLLGTAKEFGEGLLKAVVLTRAPGALNALMSRRVGLGALGTTDVGTIAGGVGVGAGTLALPTTAEALYKAGRTGKKEDWRAAVNQAGINALDFIAPEVIGSKGALSVMLKGEKLTPLQQLSRQNILTGSTANNLNDLRLSTPGLDQVLDMSRNLRSYAETFAREQGSAPVFASLQDDTQYQLMDLYDQRRAVDRTLQDLRNQGATNSPYFQGAIDERDYLTRQIDNLNTQTRDRIAALRQEALGNYTGSQSEFPVAFQGSLPSSSSASNIDEIINRVQQLRLEPTPTPAPITRTAPRTVSSVQTDAELQKALTAANKRIAALPDDSEERRMFEVFASELNSSLNARRNYTEAVNQFENARRTPLLSSMSEEELTLFGAGYDQARIKLAKAKENLKIADPEYYKINETSRQLLDQQRFAAAMPGNASNTFDLTRPTPGVTTYDANSLPAVSQRDNLFEGALSSYNTTTEPVKFSESTRAALRNRPARQRGMGSTMTVSAQLRSATDPIDFANRLRNMLSAGTIDVSAYKEISKTFRNTLGQSPDAANILDFDYAKMILETDPQKIYTGSTLSRNEALNELKAIPEDELNAILQQNYGYTLDDVESILMNPNTPDNVSKIAMNQILDDYEHVVQYNTLNPHAPAIDFMTRQVVSPKLQSTVNEIDLLGLSDKTAETIKKTSYKGQQDLTTGTVSYSGTERPTLPKINNKDYIVNNVDLDDQLSAYEEAFGKLQNNRGPVYNDIRNRYEDLKATKWLRTEYADELKAAGLDPKEIEKITVITTGGNSKSLVNADGDVIGTLNFGTSTYEGTKFSEISSTGVNLKFHGYNLKRSKFKTWEEAEQHLAKRYLDDALATITNPSDKKNPIVVKSLTKKANDRAAAEVAQIQVNNNNRFGEALYRGVHHGIKDTRGGIGTKEHFVDTSLPDPITGERVTRKRAKDYWYSQIKQKNDKGIGKAGKMAGPLRENDAAWGVDSPIFILRKLGGDVSKLSRFIS